MTSITFSTAHCSTPQKAVPYLYPVHIPSCSSRHIDDIHNFFHCTLLNITEGSSIIYIQYTCLPPLHAIEMTSITFSTVHCSTSHTTTSISIFSTFCSVHICYCILLAVCCNIHNSLSHIKQFQTTVYQYVLL